MTRNRWSSLSRRETDHLALIVHCAVDTTAGPVPAFQGFGELPEWRSGRTAEICPKIPGDVPPHAFGPGRNIAAVLAEEGVQGRLAVDQPGVALFSDGSSPG